MPQSDSLAAVYADVDAALQAVGCKCRACGRCCDFAANDYILYASQIEIDLVTHQTGRQPKLSEGRCCFQNAAGRCTIHQWRPLGCRTHFCGRISDAARIARCQELYEQALQRLQRIAQRSGRGWEYRRFFG